MTSTQDGHALAYRGHDGGGVALCITPTRMAPDQESPLYH